MRFAWFTALLVLLQPIAAAASIFPDVLDDHLHREAIERLVGTQVIGGHPDGTFRPNDPVDRAAMLKMLYKASGKTPDPSHVKCFKDVPEGSWFEPFVCDAAANRYIAGYSDGTFRPGNNVNRVEAIKMITLVLGITVPEISDINREVLQFVDVSTSAWYTKYLYTAFVTGILPIPGQDGSRFYPEWPLLRSEAAAYIHNALKVDLQAERKETEEILQEEQAREEARPNRASSSSTSKSEGPKARILDTDFPFTDSQLFEEKQSTSYRFGLKAQTTVDVVVSLKAGQEGKVSCRLYKLGKDGYSNEYYLGLQEGASCYVRAVVPVGDYQLQLQPTAANTQYEVSAKEGEGDGNDGFLQAKALKRGVLRTEVLDGNDYEDWFSFTVTVETQMALEVTGATRQRCIIYPMADVDIFGFSGPECNANYLYPPGTYLVGVGHTAPRAERQTYSIRLK
ncbi:MAG: S-layer homology domain-containing protein [Candidatus Peregrinibacteria bacterium]|nr:S-layer homology domain-containing protein [Candidatus Peregrinibacteria bacterium]